MDFRVQHKPSRGLWRSPCARARRRRLSIRCVFRIQPGPGIGIHLRDAELDLPIFVDSEGSAGVFIQTRHATQTSTKENPVELFSSLAPILMFVREAAGKQGWHTNGHYANLTIDDAWLTQPFGNLDYQGLLREMGKANFHTTIAFIPWNFDRSRPEAVSLFRSHPDRYSIVVHGNNHDHQEFYDYDTVPSPIKSPTSSKHSRE